MTSFKKQIPEYRELIDDSLNKILPTPNQSSKELNLAMAYSVLNGGKRIRPLMMLASAKTLDVDIQEVIPFAASIELLHSFSLIHDDLPCMDDDDLRRGAPTLHKKYSESTAVLAGDAMQSLAIQIILEDHNLSSEIKVMITKFLMETIGNQGMILGQALDIEFEEQQVSKDQIIHMNHLKTGLLIEFCVLAPVLIANTRNEDWEQIASNVGISFQLIDDLLDLQESEENLGKATNKDQIKNKKSVPLVLGISETLEEINKYEAKTMESITNLGLNNHPLTNYLQSLFCRRK